MFEPRHNILSNVRADIRKYVVSWLKLLRASNGPVPGPMGQSRHLEDQAGLCLWETMMAQMTKRFHTSLVILFLHQQATDLGY